MTRGLENHWAPWPIGRRLLAKDELSAAACKCTQHRSCELAAQRTKFSIRGGTCARIKRWWTMRVVESSHMLVGRQFRPPYGHLLGGRFYLDVFTLIAEPAMVPSSLGDG